MYQLHDVGLLAAGYMIALESVSWTLGALLFSGIVGRAQTRVIRLSFIGFLISSVGLSFFVMPGPVWALLPFLFVAGMAFGSCYGHIVQGCTEAVPVEDRDRTAGAMPTIQAIGYALGAAICGLIANLVGYSDNFSRAAAEAAGIWVFVAVIPLAVMTTIIIRWFRPN